MWDVAKVLWKRERVFVRENSARGVLERRLRVWGVVISCGNWAWHGV